MFSGIFLYYNWEVRYFEMTSLLQSHEQQYAVLTAEITSEIGKLKRMPAGSFDFIQYIE